MRLKQTFKEKIERRWHLVWTDLDSQASFVYVGEKLDPASAKTRLLKLLQTETWTPGAVHWVWSRLEAME